MNDDTYERYLGGTVGGPVTCRTCGCRLAETRGEDGPAWEHFRMGPETDARGCPPACLPARHSRDGRGIGFHDTGSAPMRGLAAAP